MSTVKALILLSVLTLVSSNLGFAAEELPAGSLTVHAQIPRGGDFMGFGFDSLWMMSRPSDPALGGGPLVRVNATDNSVTDIDLGSYGKYRAMGIGEGAVWVPASGRDLILKIDPNSNKLVQEIPAQMVDSEGSIGVGEGGIWVLTAAPSSATRDTVLTRYHPGTGAVEAEIPLPSASAGVVVDFGSVWVTGFEKGELYRIDPKSNAVISIIKLHDRPRFIASGESSIWVLNQGDGTVQRIDGRTGEVLATIQTIGRSNGGDIVCGGGYVWVSAPMIPVAQIDPKTNTLIRRFSGSTPMGDAIRYGAGSLWVSGQAIFRIKPPD
jgi:virginiamycin B lyase